MSMRKITTWLLILSMLFSFAGCATQSEEPQEPARMYLYGESHAEKRMIEKELELWQGYYADGLRHLFIEYPYYTAEYLNLWMRAEDDTILDAVLADLTGTIVYQNEYVRDFFIRIKQTCPETVFHGTDIGHQYQTTGARYLAYLEDQGLEDTETYTLTLENIAQGRTFYEEGMDQAYRENCMSQNFMREYDALGGQSVMGIYGSAHLNVEDIYWLVPRMAFQLQEVYGDAVIIREVSDVILEELEK